MWLCPKCLTSAYDNTRRYRCHDCDVKTIHVHRRLIDLTKNVITHGFPVAIAHFEAERFVYYNDKSTQITILIALHTLYDNKVFSSLPENWNYEVRGENSKTVCLVYEDCIQFIGSKKITANTNLAINNLIRYFDYFEVTED